MRKALQEMMRPLVEPNIWQEAHLASHYQYDDAKPKDVVLPAPIFGKTSGKLDADNQVDSYGKWLTSTENPRFTKVIANRMWKKVFGRGLVEPADDWRDDTQASIPELLVHLEKLMTRRILNSLTQLFSP